MLPATTITAGPVRRHGRLVIIPVARTVRWSVPPGYGASSEPLGLLLIEEGEGEMRILPFAETSSWWEAFCTCHPAFAGIVPETPSANEGTPAGADA
ncbi:hypothetical protein AZH53_09130 [Methanomicrobiaceae archaeon CYW5]|nr:hypothetical protein [Methanovulcanius yangii]